MEEKYLHDRFADFKLPEEIAQLYKLGLGVNMFGPINLAKTIIFCEDNNVDNFIIDHYMGIKPKREESETYTSYKNRLKFQKVLYKYRKFLYDYSVFVGKTELK